MTKPNESQISEENSQGKLETNQLVEEEFVENLPPSLEFDNEEVDFEDETLFNKRTIQLLAGCLVLTIMVFALVLGSLLYPSAKKVSGEWETSKLDQLMGLTVKNGHAVLEVGHLTLPKAMSVSFEGELLGKGMNSYGLKELVAFVTVDKTEMASNDLKELRDNKEQFEIETETDTKLRLKYTVAGLTYLLGDENGERYFQFTREGVWFGEEPLLYLNNSQLAEDRILFRKID